MVKDMAIVTRKPPYTSFQMVPFSMTLSEI